MTQPGPASPQPAPAWLVIAAGIALFLLVAWVAIRGGLMAPDVNDMSPENLPHVGQMIEARCVGVLYIVLSSLPMLAALIFGAAGWGWPFRRWLAPRAEDRWVIQGAAGLATMLLVDYLLALAGGLNIVGAWLVCAIGVALFLTGFQLDRATSESKPFRLPWLAAGIAAPAALLLVAACCPPGTLWSVEAFGYDVMSYHLQIPRQWLAAGRMTGLHENVYGYLPSLVEAGYMQMAAMAGGVYEAIYLCQLASVCAGVLAAAGVGALAARFSPPRSASGVRWATAAIFLATPWTLITGSLAYDEMAMLAFGAAAILLVFDPRERSWKSAALIGLLAGGATLAKLTAGFMIALPVGLLLLLVVGPQPRPWLGFAGRRAAVAAIVGFLTLSPYLIRNAAWTGNPVFPFAADTLGRGHWSEFDVDRWEHGHHIEEGLSQRIAALGEQWVFNRGYGAVGGESRARRPGEIESRNIARFAEQGGVPTLVAAALLGLVLLLTDPARRRFALALAMVLAVQLICWTFVTHLQSRFLIPWLLAGCPLAGAGLAKLDELVPVGPRPFAWLAVALLAGLVVISGQTFMTQTIAGVPPWQAIDSLPPADLLDQVKPDQFLAGDHPVNHLPPGSKTLLVADNSRLLYICRPMVYSSAFDTSPLGELIRQHPGNDAAVTEALKQMGITHVWVHLPELERLMATYGYDPDVTPATLAKLEATGWTPVINLSHGQVVLYRLP